MAKELMEKMSAAQKNDVSDPIVPLGSLAYMRPTYLVQSAWTEHIPFAFWLIEALRPALFVELGTHWGLSYFAFCQALDRLDPGAKAFAVDTWTGDEHSGKYGAEVFNGVRNYNDVTYRHLSSLRKCRFDDAREYFLDGSVDLLHIDGLHTYEAVSHDFESWRPKMSRRGVIVFHDTNVRERDFGVFRLFGELKEKYPTFEFTHGHGLGIVGVGDEQTEKMGRLFDADKSARQRSDLHALFSGLGRACLDSYKAQKADQALTDVKRQFEGDLAKQREAAQQADVKAANLGAEMNRMVETHSAAAACREADARAIEESITRLTQSLARAEREIDALQDQNRAKEGDIIAATMRERELGNKLAETQSALAQRQHETDQYVAEVAGLRRDLDLANSMLGERDKIIAGFKEHILLLMNEFKEKSATVIDAQEPHKSLLREAEEKRVAAEDELRKEKSRNEASEKRRHHEISTLTQLLKQAESNNVAQSEDLQRARRAAEEAFERLGKPSVRGPSETISGYASPVGLALGRAILEMIELPGLWTLLPHKAQLKRKVELLKQTGVFDAEWYGGQYEDVAKSGIDPTVHYIKYGAAEGRLPSGSF